MQVWMIYNPVAGHRDVEAEVLKAQQLFRSLGWETTMHRTRAAGHAGQLAQEAREAGVELVVAIGGDGTIGQVAEGLVGSSVRLGVIPVGTGNVWAHMLGIPVWSPANREAVMAAARAVAGGETRAIDVGQAGGRYFLLWAGLGFDALVAHEIEPHREIRRSLGNWAYLVTALAQSLVMRGVRTTVVIDGRAYRHRLIMLIVTNAQLYGPKWSLAPQAQLDDGWLDVYLFKGNNTIDTFRHLFTLMAGKQSVDPQIETYRAREIKVLADRPLPVHLDGDPCGATPVTIRVVPRVLQVVVPRWSPNALFAEGGFEERAAADTLGERINQGWQGLLRGWHSERERFLEQLGVPAKVEPSSATDAAAADSERSSRTS